MTSKARGKRRNVKELAFFMITLTILIFMGLAEEGWLTSIKEADQEDELVHAAFKAIIKAHNEGGDVKPLVDKLNEAIRLLSMAKETEDPDEAARLRAEAEEMLRSIIEEAPEVAEEGRRRALISYVFLGCSLVCGAVACVVAYKFGPRAFWRLWVRLRRNYRVRMRPRPRKRETSMLISGEVWAVILAIILVGVIFAVSQAIWAERVIEPFSELGVLGPHMKIGDYPSEVVAGDTFKLYIYVGNHMGKPMLYTVLVKLCNKTMPVDPAPVEPMMSFTHALLNNETWISPINVTLTDVGLNWRLVFELWAYNPETDRVEYLGLSCWLWINVTAPA